MGNKRTQNTPNGCPNGDVPSLDHQRPAGALFSVSRESRVSAACLNLRQTREQTQLLS